MCEINPKPDPSLSGRMMHVSPMPIPQQADRWRLPELPGDEGFLKPPVIDVQPTAQAPVPKVVPETSPPSPLQDLSPVDQLYITKRLRVKSVLFLRGKKNRFFVRTSDQSLVYSVEEENNWWVGYFCYNLRPLQLKVSNGQGVEVLRVDRPFACTARVLPCQLQRLRVYSPPEQCIGTIEQQWTPVKPKYLVKNRDGELVFRICGPLITISFFNTIKFNITRPDGTPVGGTCKRWQGLTHALFFSPVTDRFDVVFDVDLAVDEKALLLAATLLMDYMYYDA